MSAFVLKLIACVCMLADHIGYFEPGMPVLRIVGRLAMPIYVYLLVEGFQHTSNRRRYALRLLVFAVLSQIPFGLLFNRDPLYPVGSVMVTLLLGYLCIWILEALKEKPILRLFALAAIIGLCVVLDLGLVKTDYGAKGILLILVFRFFAPPVLDREKSLLRRILFALLLCLLTAAALYHVPLLKFALYEGSVVIGTEAALPVLSAWEKKQVFALCAIPLILFYNGKRGLATRSRASRKVIQYAFYAFYPVHMVILYFIFC